MTRNQLNDLYFEWLYRLVCNERYSRRLSYRRLLQRLHSIDFEYIIPMDGNRAEDGIELRYRFANEHNYKSQMIASYLDDRPCSILEMMIALAIRCEEDIMDNPDVGDRTGQWFWNMIVSLGLGRETDNNFDRLYVDKIIDRFLKREYDPDGNGGLFTVKYCDWDMRSIEIWYQMCRYMDTIL